MTEADQILRLRTGVFSLGLKTMTLPALRADDVAVGKVVRGNYRGEHASTPCACERTATRSAERALEPALRGAVGISRDRSKISNLVDHRSDFGCALSQRGLPV